MISFKHSQLFGIFLLVTLLGLAFLQPYYYTMDDALQNFDAILEGPSTAHWLGTDHLGRDMFARLASAIRLSFSMVILSVGGALLFGLLLGILSGYKGGWIDRLCSFLTNIILALPGLLFVLLFAAISPGSFWALYLGIAFVMWVEFFRVIRAITRTLVHSPEIENSRLMGMSFGYCFKRHFFPKLAPIVLTLSAFSAGNAVLALATLGFISVGLRPPTAELGLMMTELFPYYYEAPFIFSLPIITVCCLVLSFHLISGKNQ